MVIRFICPNGHQLSAPEERAGKPGKCPKCETEFVVPELEEFEEIEEQPVSIGESADQPANVSEPESGQIVFLCPNGHKLNGPASLMGKPGQCPQCGSKFRIPDDSDDDEMLEHGEDDTDIPMGERVDNDERPSEPVEQLGDTQPVSATSVDELPMVEPVFDEPLPPPSPDGSGALSVIVRRLWQGHKENQVIEIHLDSKLTIVAKSFSPVLSGPTHGVFAFADGDSTHTVVAIPWESVTRIEFPRVGELREDLFE